MNRINFRKQLTRPLNWFKKQTKAKKIIFSIAVLLVIALFFSFFGTKKSPEYETARVQKGNVQEIVSESGPVTNGGSSDIYSVTNGVVQKIYVRNGEEVFKGQDLFSVQSSASDIEKANAYAAHQNALATLASAQQTKLLAQSTLEQNRQSILDAQNKVNYKNEHISNPATGKNYTQLEQESINSQLTSAREAFTANEKKYKDADIAIGAAQAQVNSTWLSYLATQTSAVKATTDGTIANLSVFEGSSVKSLQQSSISLSQPPVLTIISPSTTEVTVSLNEIERAKVNPGQRAKIAIKALNKAYSGTVNRVDSVGTENQSVVKYNAYITLHTSDYKIKSGMTADTTIVTNTRENVLVVPNEAIKPYRGGKAVQIFDTKTEKIVNIPVEVGIRGENKTEVIKGISEGSFVIIASPLEKTQSSSFF